MEHDLQVSASDFESLCNGIFSQSANPSQVSVGRQKEAAEGFVETKLSESPMHGHYFEVDLGKHTNDIVETSGSSSSLSRTSSIPLSISRNASDLTASAPSSMSLGRGQSAMSDALFSFTTDAHFGLAQSTGSTREDTEADSTPSIEIVELTSGDDDVYEYTNVNENANKKDGSNKKKCSPESVSKIPNHEEENKFANVLPPPLPLPPKIILETQNNPNATKSKSKKKKNLDSKNVQETQIGGQRRSRRASVNQLGQIKLFKKPTQVEQIDEERQINVILGQRRKLSDVSELKLDSNQAQIPVQQKKKKLSVGERMIALPLNHVDKAAASSPIPAPITPMSEQGANSVEEEEIQQQQIVEQHYHEQSLDLMESIPPFPPSYSDDEFLSILQEVGVELGQEMIYPTCKSDHEQSSQDEDNSDHEYDTALDQIEDDFSVTVEPLYANTIVENIDKERMADGHEQSQDISADLPYLTYGDERISQIAEAMQGARSRSPNNKPIPLSKPSQLWTQHDLAQIVADARIKENNERLNSNKSFVERADRAIQQLRPLEYDDCKMGANPSTSLSQIAELLTTQRMKAAINTKPSHARTKKYGYVARYYSPSEQYDFLKSIS